MGVGQFDVLIHRDARWLNCAEWGSPLCQVEEDTLYSALLNPFIDPSSR
jgi:hypothetical protein